MPISERDGRLSPLQVVGCARASFLSTPRRRKLLRPGAGDAGATRLLPRHQPVPPCPSPAADRIQAIFMGSGHGLEGRPCCTLSLAKGGHLGLAAAVRGHRSLRPCLAGPALPAILPAIKETSATPSESVFICPVLKEPHSGSARIKSIGSLTNGSPFLLRATFRVVSNVPLTAPVRTVEPRASRETPPVETLAGVVIAITFVLLSCFSLTIA